MTSPLAEMIGQRLQDRYFEAAETVFMDGSTPWEVDDALAEFGFAVGPFEQQDIDGLDGVFERRKQRAAGRAPLRRHVPIIDRMMELGKLGRKTGAGWYRYPGGGGKVEDPIVADLALEESYFERRTRCDYAPEEIRQRVLLAVVLEAACVLEQDDHVTTDAINEASISVLGVPAERGGILGYADQIGASQIAVQLEGFRTEDPLTWPDSQLLRYLASKQVTFADFDRETFKEWRGQPE